jgi:hypothetical protein
VLTGDNEKQGRWAMMGAGFGVEHAFFKVLPAGFFPITMTGFISSCH